MSQTKGAVLVLGASRGLGHAIAFALGRAGFAVGVACRQMSDAASVAATLQDDGTSALPLVVDVTNFSDVERAVQTMADWHGQVAGLVNNAGIIDPIDRLAETDVAAWARLITVNLTGAYHGVRAALPYLAAGGVIVNVSSGAADHPMEGWSAYCASKAALTMLTQSIHHEYGRKTFWPMASGPVWSTRTCRKKSGRQGSIRSASCHVKTCSSPKFPPRALFGYSTQPRPIWPARNSTYAMLHCWPEWVQRTL